MTAATPQRRLRWAKALCTFALLATPAQTASADTIETLVARLRREVGSEGATDAAAKLANLAFEHADNQVTIAAAGAIEPLVALVRGGSEGAKAGAAGALRNLAYNNAANRAAMERLGHTL